jgi:DNA-directed RNA polymerase specialized sigma subunit
MLPMGPWLDVEADERDPDESMARVQAMVGLIEAVRAAAEALPERHRLVIVGTLDGRGTKDIAAEMGVCGAKIHDFKKVGISKIRRALVGPKRRRRDAS